MKIEIDIPDYIVQGLENELSIKGEALVEETLLLYFYSQLDSCIKDIKLIEKWKSDVNYEQRGYEYLLKLKLEADNATAN